MLEVLLRTPAAAAVERRLFTSRQTMHVPHLIDVEVAQVIRRYAATRELDADRGRGTLSDLADFPLCRYPHDLLLPRVWELRNNLTACDAVYVALAEAEHSFRWVGAAWTRTPVVPTTHQNPKEI
jgi:predicted nucleic acid-binding protein